MPILSVIIPVYNAEKYLNRSVNSVLNQTFRDLELILVDDGSCDSSLDICREYEKNDGRVRVIVQKNLGAGPARNAGIKVSQGKYLAFLDSDDYIDLNAYENCIGKIEETDVDLLVFGIATDICDEDEKIVEHRLEKIPEVICETQDECRKRWVYLHQNMNMNSPCNKIYRRSIIEDNVIKFPDLRRMEDCIFNIHYFDKISSFISIKNNYFIRTWHSAKTEIKKLPDSIVDIGIICHKTAKEFLKKWGVCSAESELFFDKWFAEFVVFSVKSLVSNSKTLTDAYHRCCKVSKDEYVHNFFSRHQYNANLSKQEKAIYYKLNLILAVYYFRKINKKELNK